MPVRFIDSDLRYGVREETRRYLDVHRSSWDLRWGRTRKAFVRICILAGAALLINTVSAGSPIQKPEEAKAQTTPQPPSGPTIEYRSKTPGENSNALILRYGVYPPTPVR